MVVPKLPADQTEVYPLGEILGPSLPNITHLRQECRPTTGPNTCYGVGKLTHTGLRAVCLQSGKNSLVLYSS